MDFLEQITFNTSRGPHYAEDDPSVLAAVKPLVRLIAFYLPQFHPIPENDAWWGKGFTEWTNVTKALPRFEGHYQPRLPGELGFYDLTQAGTLRRQATLARRYGIAGFCFHHYWFFGKRLLEQPLQVLLANPDIDMPFCVNWANEPWSRRWDGNDRDILMPQDHSPKDDIAFAKSLEPLFRDPRYIRINGRPLLMLYRPAILPDAAATVSRWRTHFKDAGLGDPYIVMTQVRGDGDPTKYGMDAAAGFPPFWAGKTPHVEGLPLFDRTYRGEMLSYAAMAAATLQSHAAGSRVFPGVCPSWDNEARKPGAGTCFTRSTPEAYGMWLHAACGIAMQRFPEDERLVFINAWNEWAEGAYLEPDRHFGHAYLVKTAQVLNGLVLPSGQALPDSRPAGPVTFAARQTPPLRHRLRKFARRTLNRCAAVAEGIGWKLRNM